MRSRHELLVIFAIVVLTIWFVQKTPSPNPRAEVSSDHTAPTEVEEYEVFSTALNFLLETGYGAKGEFFVVIEQSAVPFPGNDLNCPFYESPPEHPHRKRIEVLEKNLKSDGLSAFSSGLKEQNKIRINWDLAKLSVQSKVRGTDVFDKASHSGEFFSHSEELLGQVNGRALLQFSRPTIVSNKALFYVVDHSRWRPSVVLISLERNETQWRVVASSRYSPTSHCQCGP